MSTPQQRGREFEAEWAEVFGVKPQRGSGNLYYAQLDVDDRGSILWSVKHTDDKSFRLTETMIRESREATMGPGSSGDRIPGIAIRIGGIGQLRVDMDARDFMRLITEGARYVKPSKMQQKRALADVPAALRRARGTE